MGDGVKSTSDRLHCYTYSTPKAPDKGEVGGSSPPRPTIITSKYAAILTFPLSGNISQKPFCQKSAKSPSRLQLPVRVRAATYCELSKAAMYCFRDPAARFQPKCKASPSTWAKLMFAAY